MTIQRPRSYFALAILSGVFFVYTFRLNPEGFNAVDVVAAIAFGVLAVGLTIAGILRMRTRR